MPRKNGAIQCIHRMLTLAITDGLVTAGVYVVTRNIDLSLLIASVCVLLALELSLPPWVQAKWQIARTRFGLGILVTRIVESVRLAMIATARPYLSLLFANVIVLADVIVLAFQNRAGRAWHRIKKAISRIDLGC